MSGLIANGPIDRKVRFLRAKMDYFGIKTPPRGNEAPYIWWIANSRHEAWMSFFQYPSAKREINAHRLPIAEAIQAYEAIGYQCVALEVQEKPNVDFSGSTPLHGGESAGLPGDAGETKVATT